MNWVFYATLAAISCATSYFCFDVLTQKYNDSLEISCILFIALGLIYSIIYMMREKTITFEPKTKKIYALLIFVYFVFVYAVIQGIRLSPHAGYVQGIVNSSTAILFLIYLVYCKRELKINHVIGLLFVFGGLLILVNASVTEPKVSLKHIL